MNQTTAHKGQGWLTANLAVGLVIATPILFVLGTVFRPAGDVWDHLAETVLGSYLTHSFLLMGGVGIGVAVIGVGTAWMVSLYRFPGSKLLEWALILPMSVPAYLMAYTYTDLLDYAGPVMGALRDWGWLGERAGLGGIRSIEGAMVMMSFVFYPYVYLLTRTAFVGQGRSLLEAGRGLGASPMRIFTRIALPLARPAIAAGVSLALMETLNDFGTVQYFGVPTFTTGIYRTWYGLGEPVAAAQLSALLFLFVLVLIALETWSRRAAPRHLTARTSNATPSRIRLTGAPMVLAMTATSLPLLVGFVIPAGVLLKLMFRSGGGMAGGAQRLLELSGNSLLAGALAGALAVAIALLLAYGKRLAPTPVNRAVVRIASTGYAIPGSVIAVGLLLSFAAADRLLGGIWAAATGRSAGLILSGTLLALIMAYVVRFLAVAFGSVDASLSQVTRNMDEAAMGLGHSFRRILLNIHLPMVSPSMFAAMLLVFVDVIKELPATLIVRPFGFDTLAVQVYRMASDERLAEASGAALAIVAVGLIPVVLLSRQIRGVTSTRRDP